MPFSAAWWRMAKLLASSTCRPNVMVPRQMRETWSPVRPSRTCCTACPFLASGGLEDLECERELRQPGARLEPREVPGDRGARRVHLVFGNTHHAELGLVDKGFLRHLRHQVVRGPPHVGEAGRFQQALRPIVIAERKGSRRALARLGWRRGRDEP